MAVHRVKLPDSQHSDDISQEPPRKPEFASKFPSINPRPLTSLSYEEKRACISDVVAQGCIRAFNSAHKHHVAAAEKDFIRQWQNNERYREWKARQTAKKIFPPKKERDRGVLESIVSQRNQKRKEYIARGIPPERVQKYIDRQPLPKEDRAVYQRRDHPVFFWG